MSQALLTHTQEHECEHNRVHVHTSLGNRREWQPAGTWGSTGPADAAQQAATALPHSGRRGQVAGITMEGAQSRSCCWAARPGAEKMTWECACSYFLAVLSQSMCPQCSLGVINCPGPSKEARSLVCTDRVSSERRAGMQENALAQAGIPIVDSGLHEKAAHRRHNKEPNLCPNHKQCTLVEQGEWIGSCSPSGNSHRNGAGDYCHLVPTGFPLLLLMSHQGESSCSQDCLGLGFGLWRNEQNSWAGDGTGDNCSGKIRWYLMPPWLWKVISSLIALHSSWLKTSPSAPGFPTLKGVYPSSKGGLTNCSWLWWSQRMLKLCYSMDSS